jgi:hypothetical protein
MTPISKSLAAAALAAAAISNAGAAQAAGVSWVDWTTVTVAQQVLGTIADGADVVGLTYTGPRQFAQVTGGGPDDWVEPPVDPYTGGVIDRPPGTDIIALGTGGTKTIAFSRPVRDPYLALFNWDGVTTTFSAPLAVVSEGCGLAGCGTFSLSAGGTTLDGVGHATGVLRFHGTFDTLTFTDTTSSGIVRGFRVGLAAAPEPSAWALMIVGFGAAGSALRRQRRIATGTGA